MISNNGVTFFPPPPFIHCEQWPPAGQQGAPPMQYNSPYQPPINNGQNYEKPSAFKLYDYDGTNRNEIIRFLFSVAGVSFKDKRVKQEEWERVKERIPIQKLPILRVNNQLKIYYLNAIVRYLARGFRLYGNANDDQAIIDIIFELTSEFQDQLFEQINHSTDIEERKILLNQFLTDHGINYFNQLEKFYQIFNRPGPFYLGSQLSLADLIVYQTINYFIDIQPTLLDNYDHLQQARSYLEKHPQLANYFQQKNYQVKKNRHRSVPPTSKHAHRHHRHRSHDEEKSSRRRQSKESTNSSETKEESKLEKTQSKEEELPPLLQTHEERKSPSIQLEENKSIPKPVATEEKSEPTDK
jgi:glutathione S-transferase